MLNEVVRTIIASNMTQKEKDMVLRHLDVGFYLQPDDDEVKAVPLGGEDGKIIGITVIHESWVTDEESGEEIYFSRNGEQILA